MLILLVLLSLAVAGCASATKHAVPVNYSDGVDKREASVIVDDYLRQHMSASFGHIGPYNGGGVWIFKITGDVVPVELTNVPPVFVEKKTGAVIWEAKSPLKK